MIEYKIKNKIAGTRAIFSGFVGDLYGKMIYNRMTSDFAVKEILREAEEPFFSKSDDDDAPLGWWRGEFWGKWMISAVRACKYKYDEKLASIIRDSIDKIISTQSEDGYIGTYKDPSLIYPCTEEEGRAVVGFNCNFCWNIWCRKYTLWGLIEAYELFGDDYILDSAKKHGEHLIKTLDEQNADICETGTFLGVASGSIMKPLLILYKHTEDERFLNLSLKIADGFENESSKCIKIIKKALDNVPVHVWNYDNPAAEVPFNYTSQKAYEMMSCFEGICELYRITGDQKYLTASIKFYDLLLKHEYNRLLCVGFNDRFLHAAVIEDSASEPCDIIHFLRLTLDLYLLTGDTKYAQLYEDAFLNPFLASINEKGDWGGRIIRSMSHHVDERNIVNMKYNHCCVNNMPRGFENASEFMLTSSHGEYTLNTFIPAEITLDEGVISISDGYMKNCAVKISLALKKEIRLNLRIPTWSKNTRIKADGSNILQTENLVKLTLYPHTNNISIIFDNTPRLNYTEYLRYMFPMTPYLKRRYDLISAAENTKKDMATLMIGPMLLSMATKLGTSWKEMTERDTVGAKCRVSAEPIERDGTLACYNVTLSTDKGTEVIPMCDYVSASNRFIAEDFSIFI